MTKKRFTIDEKMLGYVGEFVSDNGVRIRELSDVVELLNMLHEENKKLDEKYIDEFSLRETLQQDLQRVEAENEQLKSELQKLRKTVNKQYVTWREWE